MKKLSGLAAFIVVGLFALGGCAGPATTAQSPPVQQPAAATPVVNVPAAAAVPAPAAAPAVVPDPVPSPVPAPAQTLAAGAVFTTSNLQITPGKVSSGGQVKISATVKNTGTEAGTFSVVMEMKGDDEACPMISPVAKDVTLAAGAAQDVDFTVLMGAGMGGGFTVTVGSLKGALVVE